MKPKMNSGGTLVVVSCGSKKIWTMKRTLDLQKARVAYIGPFFEVNREYAEKFSDRWVILSAKYGFLNPAELIQDYNVTFKDLKTKPISMSILRKQVLEKKLGPFTKIVVLGGKAYADIVEEAFSDVGAKIFAPLLGKRIGEMMSAV